MRTVLSTPVGGIEIVEEPCTLRSVHFRPRARPTPRRGPLAGLLAAYLRGEAVDFSRVPIDLSQFSPFERRVLEETRRIPRGEVRTYGEIAAAAGRPRAARAVGNALNKNSAAIVIPCHRVVAAGGLGGFGGGLHMKRYLLRLEGARTPL